MCIQCSRFNNLIGTCSTLCSLITIRPSSIFNLKSHNWYQIIKLTCIFNHVLNLFLYIFFNKLLSSRINSTLIKFNILVQQLSYSFKWHRLTAKLFSKNFQHKAMFLFSLHFNHRSGHSTSWLEKENTCFLTLPRYWDGFMLMTPNNKIKKLWDL